MPVTSFKTKSYPKVTAQDLEVSESKRATISLDRQFEDGLESQLQEINQLNSRASALSTMTKPAPKSKNEVICKRQDEQLSKISHSGQGLFVLGRDLVGSSVAFVKDGIRSRTMKILPAKADATTSYSSSDSAKLPATSLSRTHRILPISSHYKGDVNLPGESISSPSSNDKEARSAEEPRPTVSLSPHEASEHWGYTVPEKPARPSGVDYTNGHLRILRMNTVEWMEDFRFYSASATADVVEGLSTVYGSALAAVIHFQASAAVYEKPYMNPALHIRAPRNFHYATIQTYPFINRKVCKIPCVRPVPSIDPNALYFVNFH
eukprot:Sro438_g143020.1 n/a (321) ;mRNA; r:28859-29821